MSRVNKILVAILVVQLALVAYVYRPGQDEATPVVHFYENIAPGDLQRITITDDENKSVTLQKVADTWTVGDEGYPAETDTVNAMVEKLTSLTSTRLVTRTKASHSRLKVSETDMNRRIDLELADGSVKTLYLGTSPTAKTIHARRQEDKEVYLVKDLSTWELQASVDSWWKARYVDIDKEQLSKIALSNALGSFRLTKNEEGNWTAVDGLGALDQKKVDELINAISRISVAKYLTRDEGAAVTGEPVASIEYTVADNDIRLQIWPEDKEAGENIVKLSSSDFYAKIRIYVLQDVLGKKLDDLAAEVSSGSPSDGAEAASPLTKDN